MLDTVILWAPDSEYSCATIKNKSAYRAGTEDEVIQSLVKEELRHGSLTLVKGPNLFNCLRKFSEHANGSGCEIVLSSEHVLEATNRKPTTVLSEVLELGFDLFGSKFLVRVV